MAELELQRAPGDRRLYELDGVGTVRLAGFASRTAAMAAVGGSWQIRPRGFWRRVLQATDSAGTAVGEFEPFRLRRGGTLRWAGREFTVRRPDFWRSRYALVDGDRELAILDGKGWDPQPVKVTVDDPGSVEPGLLLFAAYVVFGLAQGTGAGAAGSAWGG